MVRKKWLSPYYSTYECKFHQTCTNCSSWHDLLIPHGGLRPWPTFNAWVTMVRKKFVKSVLQYLLALHSPNLHQLFILTWSTDATWWFVSLTYISRLSDHGPLSLYYSTYECYIHQTCTNCSSWHDLLMPCDGLCPWPTFHASMTKTQNGNSGAPVMVPITVMSSLSVKFNNIQLWIIECKFSSLQIFCHT